MEKTPDSFEGGSFDASDCEIEIAIGISEGETWEKKEAMNEQERKGGAGLACWIFLLVSVCLILYESLQVLA